MRSVSRRPRLSRRRKQTTIAALTGEDHRHPRRAGNRHGKRDGRNIERVHDYDAMSPQPFVEPPRDRERIWPNKGANRKFDDRHSGATQLVGANPTAVEADDGWLKTPAIERHREFRKLTFGPSKIERLRQQDDRERAMGDRLHGGLARFRHMRGDHLT